MKTPITLIPSIAPITLIGYTSAGPNNRVMDDEIKRYIFQEIFCK